MTNHAIFDLLFTLQAMICPLLVAGLVSWLGGGIVFEPLVERAVWPPPRTKFSLGDILVLLVQLQVGCALTYAIFYALTRWEEIGYYWGTFAGAMLTFWWLLGVRMLERGQVRRGSPRLLFLSIVVPLGYFGVLGIFVAGFALVILLLVATALALGGNTELFTPTMLVFLLGLLAGFGTWWANWESRRILNQATDDNALADGIQFEQLKLRKTSHWLRKTPPHEPASPPASAADAPLEGEEVKLIETKQVTDG